MRKIIVMLLITMLFFQTTAFADRKLDKKEKDFDIVDYERNLLSSKINFGFEGEIRTEINYGISLNNKDKFTLSISKASGDAPEYKNKKMKYNIGEIVTYNGQLYECIQSHEVYGDPNWAPGIAHSLWKMYEVTQNSKGNVKEQHYQIKVYDENGKLVKVSNIKKIGEFSEADLNFDLGEYINTAMGYDIQIKNKNNGAKIIISAAPSFGFVILTFYLIVATFLIFKVRRA